MPNRLILCQTSPSVSGCWALKLAVQTRFSVALNFQPKLVLFLESTLNADWLFLSMILQDYAEEVSESENFTQRLFEIADDPYARRSMQMRDGIADYLGIEAGEHEKQLRGG